MLTEYNNLKKQLIKNEFNHLNPAQLKAALTSDGALLILAGAGSGKTTTVISRIAYLLKYGSAYNDSTCLPAGVDSNFIGYMKSFAESGFAPDDYITDVIKSRPVAPYNILAFTFTNKAANEMKERVAKVAGDMVYDMWIGTFHSICMKILRRHIEKLGGYTGNFTIYDTADQITLVKMCLDRLGIPEKILPPKDILGYIGRAKDNLIEPDEFENTADSAKAADVAKVYKIYQKYLRENNAVDFDDIINLTIKLFKKFDDVKNYFADKFHHVLVDEYQDTNRAQYELISLLSSKHKNLCVVGDDDQSIYGWRGADIRNIIDFENTFKNCSVIRLEQNYRSTKNILDAANSIIANNINRKGKTLWTSSGEGEKIKCYEASDDRDEADKIITTVNGLLSSDSAKYSYFAVLYRTHSQSRIIEDALVRNAIPYKIIGGLRFYERKEIKDVLAYLKLIINPLDNVSLKRIINFPKRGIGPTSVSTLEDISAREGKSMLEILSTSDDYPELSKSRNKFSDFYALISGLTEFSSDNSAADVIKELLNRSKLLEEYEKEGEVDAKTRTDNIEELVSMAVELEETENIVSPAEFLEYTSLITDTDVSDESADQITLMTVHAAKGLEYPYVFIVGLEEGLFPKTDPFSTDTTKLEEERRLCYVAVTRAKKQLFISHARRRLSFGRFMQNEPSRFIDELPFDLIDFEKGFRSFPEHKSEDAFVPAQPKPVKKFVPPVFTQDTFTDTKTYAAGNAVMHKKFGKGIIASVEASSKMTILTVDFENFGRKNIISTAVEIM